MTALLCSILLLVLFGVIVAWGRARSALDVAIGHDPGALTQAWQHRELLKNNFVARHPNRWRLP